MVPCRDRNQTLRSCITEDDAAAHEYKELMVWFALDSCTTLVIPAGSNGHRATHHSFNPMIGVQWIFHSTRQALPWQRLWNAVH